MSDSKYSFAEWLRQHSDGAWSFVVCMNVMLFLTIAIMVFVYLGWQEAFVLNIDRARNDVEVERILREGKTP